MGPVGCTGTSVNYIRVQISTNLAEERISYKNSTLKENLAKLRVNIIRQHSIKSWSFSAGVGTLHGPLIRFLYTLSSSVIRTVITVFKTNVILKSFFPEQELDLNI